jgi:hypothetical protein
MPVSFQRRGSGTSGSVHRVDSFDLLHDCIGFRRWRFGRKSVDLAKKFEKLFLAVPRGVGSFICTDAAAARPSRLGSSSPFRVNDVSAFLNVSAHC